MAVFPRRIVFVTTQSVMGSGRLRAVQIRDELLRHGYQSEIVADCREVKDAILVYIKGANIDRAAAARERGNKVVVDLIDPHQKHCHRVLSESPAKATRFFLHELPPALFDGIIFVNSFSYAQYRDYGPECLKSVIFHPWDTRFVQPARFSRFSLACLGHSNAQISVPDLTNFVLSRHVLRQEVIDQVRQYACHLSVREVDGGNSIERFGDPRARFYSKSNIKISTAAACGANIISSMDTGSSDVLDREYPYWYDGTAPLGQFVAGVREGLRFGAVESGP